MHSNCLILRMKSWGRRAKGLVHYHIIRLFRAEFRNHIQNYLYRPHFVTGKIDLFGGLAILLLNIQLEPEWIIALNFIYIH